MTPVEARRILNNLRTFARSVLGSEYGTDQHAEFRRHVTERAAELAQAFGITAGKFLKAVESEPVDQRLADRMIGTIRTHLESGREAEHETALKRAASELGRVAADWLPLGHGAVGFRPEPFLAAIPAQAVAKHVTIALAGGESVSFPIPLLRAVKALPRKTWRLSWVDSQGLHLRWTTGGLNLRPQFAHPDDPALVISPPAPRARQPQTEPKPARTPRAA